jgi:hypothetical protein
MIIDIEENLENLKVNIKLKNGTLFSNHNIPSSPFGEHEKFFSFWINNKIRIYPLKDIEFIEYIPQTKENKND